MKTFPEKIKEARGYLNLSQAQLAEEIGLTSRSIQAYELGEKKPRPAALLKLAKTLKVSIKYLKDDNCENPLEDIEKDIYIDNARKQYGESGMRDMDELLADNQALFAGGKLSQEQKDAFFQAVMTAYITCREEAKNKFGKKES